MPARHYSSSDLLALKTDLQALLPAPIKRKNLESDMQRSLISWWQTACKGFGVDERLLFSIPNGAAYGGTAEQRARRGKFMRLEGLKSGVPDLLLCVKTYDRSRIVAGDLVQFEGAHALFLELKTPTGILSLDQQLYHASLTAAGYKVCVCRTLEGAKKEIEEYLT